MVNMIQDAFWKSLKHAKASLSQNHMIDTRTDIYTRIHRHKLKTVLERRFLHKCSQEYNLVCLQASAGAFCRGITAFLGSVTTALLTVVEGGRP